MPCRTKPAKLNTESGKLTRLPRDCFLYSAQAHEAQGYLMLSQIWAIDGTPSQFAPPSRHSEKSFAIEYRISRQAGKPRIPRRNHPAGTSAE